MERGKTQNLNCKSHRDSIHLLQRCSSQSHRGFLQAVRTWQVSPGFPSPAPGVCGYLRSGELSDYTEHRRGSERSPWSIIKHTNSRGASSWGYPGMAILKVGSSMRCLDIYSPSSLKHQNNSQVSDSLQPRGIFNTRGRMNCSTSVLSNIRFQALAKGKGYF